MKRRVDPKHKKKTRNNGTIVLLGVVKSFTMATVLVDLQLLKMCV